MTALDVLVATRVAIRHALLGEATSRSFLDPRTSFFDDRVKAHVLTWPCRYPGYLYETFLILPVHGNALECPVETLHRIKRTTAGRNLPVEQYIQAGRFGGLTRALAIGCDWCSIVNGTLEMTVKAFEGNSADEILGIDNVYFRRAHALIGHARYLPGAATFGCRRPGRQEIRDFLDAHCPALSDEDRRRLHDFAGRVIDFRSIVARIESRWCPLEYIRQLAYRREYWQTDIGFIARALRRHGRVRCQDCVTLANDAAPTARDFDTGFEEYFQLLYSL